MRHLILPGLLLFATTAAQANPNLNPYREQRARLRQLDTMIVDAYDATPKKLDDEAAVHKALDLQTRTAATVQAELSGDTLAVVPGPLYGQTQNGLQTLQQRIKTLQLVEKADIALHKLDPIANAHGEPSQADIDEAMKYVGALDSRKGDLPEAYNMVRVWSARLEKKLDEMPWPTALKPIEVSSGDLAKDFVAIDAKLDGNRKQAIAILKVTSPIRRLEIFGTGGAVTLRGPVREAAGVVDGPKDARSLSDVDEGVYLLESTGPSTFSLLVGSSDTPHDRFRKVGTVAADAPVEQHDLDKIYPFLGEIEEPLVRQQLFVTLPREMFVYAREDLRADDTDFQADTRPFPHAGEPLLIVKGGVINAEGFEYRLRDYKRLAVTPPGGTPVIPAKVQPMAFTYDLKKEPEGFTEAELKAQAPIRKKYLAANDRWDVCTRKVLDKYGGSMANDMAVVTYNNGHVSKVEGLKDKAWDEADRVCKTKQFQAQTAAFDKQLTKLFDDARANRLEQIRQTWTH